MAESNNLQSSIETEGSEEAKPAGGGRNLFLLTIVMAVLLPIGAGAYLTYANYERFAGVARAAGIQLGTEDAWMQQGSTKYGQFIQLSDMVINPVGSSGKRYLLVSLGLESHNPATLEEIVAKEVVVRDTILKVLGLRTVDELADINRRGELKNALREAVNAIVHEGQIDRMYFTQFVLQ